MSEGTAFAEVDGLVLALLDGLVSLAERALRPAAETAAPMVDVRLEGRPGDRVACPGAARRSRPPAAGPEGGPPTVAVEPAPPPRPGRRRPMPAEDLRRAPSLLR